MKGRRYFKKLSPFFFPLFALSSKSRSPGEEESRACDRLLVDELKFLAVAATNELGLAPQEVLDLRCLDATLFNEKQFSSNENFTSKHRHATSEIYQPGHGNNGVEPIQ